MAASERRLGTTMLSVSLLLKRVANVHDQCKCYQRRMQACKIVKHRNTYSHRS